MSLGRPVEFDREQSLQEALHLFWKNGYRGTSLGELCDHMGLSKSSLYAAFGDKKHLFLTCVQTYSDGLLAEFIEERRKARSPRLFLRTLLTDLANEANTGRAPRGCLVMNTATEFAQTDRDVAKIVEKTIGQMRAIIEEVVEEGQAAGEIDKRLNPATAALFLVSTFAGMKTMVKAGATHGDLMKMAEMYLHQL